MTPTEMEEAIRNLQDQTNRIEEFLPNLATRGELYATRDDIRRELQSVREEVMRHTLMLNEATGDRIKVLAENLARVEATMVTKGELKESIDGLEQRLSIQIADLGAHISTLAKRRRNR